MVLTWPPRLPADVATAYVLTNEGDGSATMLGFEGGHTYSTAVNASIKASMNAPDIVVIDP